MQMKYSVAEQPWQSPRQPSHAVLRRMPALIDPCICTGPAMYLTDRYLVDMEELNNVHRQPDVNMTTDVETPAQSESDEIKKRMKAALVTRSLPRVQISVLQPKPFLLTDCFNLANLSSYYE
jgi:hypothetical protein